MIGDYEWGSGVGSIKLFLIHFLKNYYRIDATNTDEIIQALNKISGTNERQLIENLYEARLKWLQSIKNPKTGKLLWDDFGKGWQKRLDDLKAIAMPTGLSVLAALVLFGLVFLATREK